MKVQLYVYDISGGFAKNWSSILLGKQIDIVPHTGIVLDNREYFYGSGICEGEPGNCIEISPIKIIDLGCTTKTTKEISKWLHTQVDEWSEEKYHFLRHNCNHFANSVSQFLEVDPVPGWILNIADENLNGNRGRFFKKMILGVVDKTLRLAGGGAEGSNPFGKNH